MSFGLSTVEIPISQIRTSLAHRLAKDVTDWWLNEKVENQPDMLELVRGNILKDLRLTETELLADLLMAKDESYLNVISKWAYDIRNEMAQDNWLQCTQQGVNMVGREQGKILGFVEQFLKPKADEYIKDHFRALSPDERLHGDYLKKIYGNRDKLIQQGKQALETEFYRILEDRTRVHNLPMNLW